MQVIQVNKFQGWRQAELFSSIRLPDIVFVDPLIQLMRDEAQKAFAHGKRKRMRSYTRCGCTAFTRACAGMVRAGWNTGFAGSG
jgi:hypothetical protein